METASGSEQVSASAPPAKAAAARPPLPVLEPRRRSRLPRLRMPLPMSLTLGYYIFRNKLRGKKHIPLVLMLEPLHACNLTCTGCGRIREYEDTITDMLSVEDCLAAVDECGSPIVSICGGEPLIYPKIAELTRGILERKKFVYLCTNGMLIQRRIEKGEFRPHPRFFWNVHLDGLEATHDLCVEKEGVFRKALEGIRFAKDAGFRVCTNTTVYRETDMAEIEALYEYLKPLDLDGHTLSPGYSYSAVAEKSLFMTRADIHAKFKDVDRLVRRYNLITTPLYLEFLQGKRDFPCTAWGTPTRNVMGWKGPCYLITDAHHPTFHDLLDKTPWEKYGAGKDPRCRDCMAHCGYEPSGALGIGKKGGDNMKYIRWQVRPR